MKNLLRRSKDLVSRLAKAHPIITVSVTALVLVTFAGLAIWGVYQSRIKVTELRISKLATGEYSRFAEALEQSINQHSSSLKLKLIPKASNGSHYSVEHLGTGEADIALIQANTKRFGVNVRGLVYVFPEVFFWLVNDEQHSAALQLGEDAASSRIYDFDESPLGSYRIATLKEGSQTVVDLNCLLSFYELQVAEKIGEHRKVELLRIGYDQGVSKLLSGEAESAFFVSGILSQKIRDAVRDPAISLQGFENRDALLSHNPSLFSYDLPPGLYGPDSPDEVVETVATNAMLVARSDLDPAVVYELMRAIHFVEPFLVDRYPAAAIEEVSGSTLRHYPLHEGADLYYRRTRATFWEDHSDNLGILATLIGTLVAAVTLVFEVRQLRRGRREKSATATAVSSEA